MSKYFMIYKMLQLDIESVFNSACWSVICVKNPIAGKASRSDKNNLPLPGSPHKMDLVLTTLCR